MIILGARPLGTFKHAVLRALCKWAGLWTENGILGNNTPVKTVFSALVESDRAWEEALKLCPHQDLRKIASTLLAGSSTSQFLAASYLEEWDPTSLFGHTESDLDGWQHYNFEV